MVVVVVVVVVVEFLFGQSASNFHRFDSQRLFLNFIPQIGSSGIWNPPTKCPRTFLLVAIF